MAYLTKQEVADIIQKAPAGTTPEGIVAALRQQGHQLEGYAEQTRVSPNTEADKRRSVLQKVAVGLGNITGVTALAKGAAAAINAPRNEKLRSAGNKEATRIANELTQAIIKAKAEGKDTTRLERTLAQHNEQNRIFNADMNDLADLGVSNRDVAGSAIRTAGTIASFGTYGAGAKGASSFTRLRNVPAGMAQFTGATRAANVAQGAIRGAKAGAKAGAIFGGVQEAGMAVQDETQTTGDVALSAIKGVVGGAVIGGATGAVIGGVVGSFAKPTGAKGEDELLKAVTPEAKDLTPKQYDKLVKQGRVSPKSAIEPARYNLTDGERTVAIKYQNVIDKDPIKTAKNISTTIGKLDDDVATFLKQNNGIYSKGELRNVLLKGLEDVDDITVDANRLTAQKEKIVDNFIKSLDKNDLENLWKARKTFDQTQNIDKAFSGAPSLSKDIKIAFRNTIQNYIAGRTPDQTYKGYMGDMSNLYNLLDTVAVKATKQRGFTALQVWARNNPIKSNALKYGTLGWLANEAFLK